jgi:hypothetical protein
MQDTIYKQNANFVFRQIEKETILVPIQDNLGDMGSIYNLNPVAAFIWRQLDGVASVRDIQTRVTAEFDVSDGQAAADLNELITDLIAIEAILPVGDP